jgi:hypothetical protein
MALNATQKVTVAEITYETYEVIDALADDLTAEQETSIVADIALWATIRNSHVKLTGTADFDNERKREAIRRRVRRAFGLPLISPEIEQGSVSIPVRAVF